MNREPHLLSPGASGGVSQRPEHEVGILARTLFSGMCLRGYKVQHVISFCNVLLELVIEHGDDDAPVLAGTLPPAAQPMPAKGALDGLAQEAALQPRKVTDGNHHE